MPSFRVSGRISAHAHASSLRKPWVKAARATTMAGGQTRKGRRRPETGRCSRSREKEKACRYLEEPVYETPKRRSPTSDSPRRASPLIPSDGGTHPRQKSPAPLLLLCFSQSRLCAARGVRVEVVPTCAITKEHLYLDPSVEPPAKNVQTLWKQSSAQETLSAAR